MTDSIARIKSRGATQARLDLKGKTATRTGKTRKGKLNCTAGNKQCGSRCIPQAWDCRLEGKGTNSELKSHSHDPLGGVASIERGIKTIAKDPTSVQNLDRGRNSIIRGIVKTVPGDNLEQKKKLKRDLQKYGNQIGSALLLGATVVGAHQSAKRLNKSYASGLGRSIDMAAFGAVDAVLDRTPFVRDRRSNIRGNAVGVSEGLGRAFLFKANKEGSEARALVNRGRIGPLSMPPGQTEFQSSGFTTRMQELQRNVRGTDSLGRVVLDPATKKPIKKIGYEEWVRGATKALYGAEADGLKGRSIYSNDAANRFVARQFGLAGSDFIQSPGGTRKQSNLNADAVIQLRNKLNVWGDTMRADMNLRRYETDAKGNFTSNAISKYVDTQVVPNMGLAKGGLAPQQQNIARRQARELATDILKTKGSDNYKSQATMIRSRISTGYDKYFKEVSNSMGISPLNKQSTFGDGQVGLARYVTKSESITAGRVTPIKSRSHANLILRDYFTTTVSGNKGGTFTSSANTVQRVAQQINGSRALPDVGSAYSIVRESGISSLRPPSEAPSTGKKKTTSKPKKPAKTGLAAQRSQSDLARAIMKREGFEGSYAEALAQARREMKRSDAAEVRDDAKKSQGTGKPCGESHIPRTHTCNANGGGSNKPARSEKAVSYQKKANTQRAAALATAAAAGLALVKGKTGVGLVAAATAAVTERQARKNSYKAKNLKTTEQLAVQYDDLKKAKGVNPEAVQQLQDFITDKGMSVSDVDPNAKMLGQYRPSQPDKYFVGGKTPKSTSKYGTEPGKNYTDSFILAAEDSMQRMKTRDAAYEALPKGYSQANYAKYVAWRRTNWNTALSKDEEAAKFTTQTHELAHSIHHRGNWQTPSSVTVNGKTYSGTELEKELKRGTSGYGGSDVSRPLYAMGAPNTEARPVNRVETFAESYVLYVGAGKNYQKDFPVSYEWTRQTVEMSLNSEYNNF